MTVSPRKKTKLAKLDLEQMNREPGVLSRWELFWWVIFIATVLYLIGFVDDYFSKTAFACYFIILICTFIYDDAMRRRIVKWFGI